MYSTLQVLEFFTVVWQQPYRRISDIGKIGNPFNTLYRANHIITERPEGFCFIIAGFNVPPQGEKSQRKYPPGVVTADFSSAYFSGWTTIPFGSVVHKNRRKNSGFFGYQLLHRRITCS